MINNENGNNKKSISLVSIIIIILAGLLIIGLLVLDINNSLTNINKISLAQQEIIATKEDNEEQNKKQNENEKQNENSKKENESKNQKTQQPNEQKQVELQNKIQEQEKKQEQNNPEPIEAKKQEEQQVKPETTETKQPTKPAQSSGGKIFLTFDDGPSDEYTGKILDILKKYNVKATFFVTGRGSDALIKREYDEGHSIGLHSYTHTYKTVYESEKAYFNDIAKVDQRVFNITGQHTKIVRFPGGASNTVSKFNPGIMTRLAKQVKEKGYKYWDWNVSSGDAGETKDPDKIFENVKNGVTSTKRNIVLLHDIHEYTANSIEKIIVWAKENNYQFYRIEESMDPVQHKIAN